jgi:hypothetical protein
MISIDSAKKETVSWENSKCMKSEKSRNIKQSEAGNDGWLELKFISNPLESRGAEHTGGVQVTAQHSMA